MADQIEIERARVFLSDLRENLTSYHQPVPGEPGHCTCGRASGCTGDAEDLAAIATLAAALAERDADVRAVARLLRELHSYADVNALKSVTRVEERFADRIAALDARTTDSGATQAERCDSRVHRDFANGQDIRCELPAGHAPHRNGEREWQP